MDTCCSQFRELTAVIRKAEVNILHCVKEIQLNLATIDYAVNQHKCIRTLPKLEDDEVLQGMKDLFGFK